MLSLLSLAPFLTLASALPTTPGLAAEPRDAAVVESWTIPRLDMHLMSVDTGLPGGQWPKDGFFNDTISFDVVMPHYTVTCQASFPNGTLPANPGPCSGAQLPVDEQVTFTMTPYTASNEGVYYRPDLSFVLDVQRSPLGEVDASTFSGSSPVTANDPQVPSSYLTCVLGAPMDGLRCNIHGAMSVRNDLVIRAVGDF